MKQAAPNLLTRAAFARLKGWSKSYVTELGHADRLILTDNGKLIKLAETLARLAETADLNRDDVKSRHAADRAGKGPAPDPEADRGTAAESAPAPAEKAKPEKPAKPVKDASAISFAKSRAEKEHYQALQAKIEYEKAIGQLVSSTDLAAAVADVVTTFRQALENFPNLVAPQLMGKDINAVRGILKQELHAVLANLAREAGERVQKREGQGAAA